MRKLVKPMKLVSVSVLALCLTVVWFQKAEASTKYNHVHNYVAKTVETSDLVPFLIGLSLDQNISVYYPGKIIKREELYVAAPTGCQWPFSASVNTVNIKYYKNGKYRTTHTPKKFVSHVRDSCTFDDDRSNNPNSNLSSKYTYKAVGSGSFFSTETLPGVVSVKVTDKSVK